MRAVTMTIAEATCVLKLAPKGDQGQIEGNNDIARSKHMLERDRISAYTIKVLLTHIVHTLAEAWEDQGTPF